MQRELGPLGAHQHEHQETFQNISGVLQSIWVSLPKNTNYIKPLTAFQNLISYAFMQFQSIRLHFILNFSSVSQRTLLCPFFIKYTIIKKSVFENTPCKCLTKIQIKSPRFQSQQKKKNKEKRLLKLSSVFSVIILPNYTDFFVADYHTMFLSRVCKAMHKIWKEKENVNCGFALSQPKQVSK